MNYSERQLLSKEAPSTKPRLCLRTRTRIDTGRWRWGTRVWVCVMKNELILLAVGRRRYLERIAIADCHATHYAAATGELVIEPGEILTFSRFAMSPQNALNVLHLLKTEN